MLFGIVIVIVIVIVRRVVIQFVFWQYIQIRLNCVSVSINFLIAIGNHCAYVWNWIIDKLLIKAETWTDWERNGDGYGKVNYGVLRWIRLTDTEREDMTKLSIA